MAKVIWKMENDICRKTFVSPLLSNHLSLDQRLRRHQVVAEIREILERPDDLLRGRHLEYTVVVAAGDHSVAVRQPDGAEDRDAVTFRSVAGRSRATVQIHLVSPNHFSGAVIFAQLAVALVTDKVMAVVELAYHARVPVGVWMINRERDLLDVLTFLVYFKKSGVTALGDQRQPVLQTLIRMNLDATGVTFFRLRFVPPDDLLIAVHFDDGRVTGLKEHIAVGQHLDVVNLARVIIGSRPFDLAFGVHDRDLLVVGSEHAIVACVINGLLGFRLRRKIGRSKERAEQRATESGFRQ